MRYVSTFTGVGGFDLGLDRAGFQCIAQVEADPWRREVLAAHWPDVPRWDDVRGFHAHSDAHGRRLGDGDVPRADDLRRDPPELGSGEQGPADCDLLCGGFPCQDLSVAGRRKGLDGARSGLFWEFARIADELRPRVFLIENVPGLLSSAGGGDMAAVLGTMAECGDGYRVAYGVLDSQYFGVPQRRRRVFIVGCAGDGTDPSEVFRLITGGGGNPAPGHKAGPEAAGPLGGGPDGTVSHALTSRGFDASEDGTGRGTPMVVSPAVTAKWVKGTGGPAGDECQNLVVSTLQATTGHGDRSMRLDAESAAGGHLLPQSNGVRRLTPVECERLQGFPDNWTAPDALGGPGQYEQRGNSWRCVSGVPDSKRYSAMGDAVTVPVIEVLGRAIRAACFDRALAPA